MNDTERHDLERAVAALSLQHRLITPDEAVRIIQIGRTGSRPLVDMIREQVREEDLLKAVSLGLGGRPRYYNLDDREQPYRLDADVLRRCDVKTLKTYSALPLVDRSGRVVLAAAYPDPMMMEYLRSVYTEGIADFLLTGRDQIQNKLASFASADRIAAFTDEVAATPVRATTSRNAPPQRVQPKTPELRWIEAVLDQAVAEGASDIHLSIRHDETLKLDFRLDGMLRNVPVPDALTGSANVVMSALMMKTGTMDAANAREPQDGTFSFEAASRQIDTRVALLPEANGPYLVLRILDSKNVRTRLDDMGFSKSALTMMRESSSLSQGTVLVSGPTGSGKSTTLYGLLREVDSIVKNVITIEDPVEYRLPGIKQIPVRSNIGDKSITFHRALRSILRMDPDVILVGEIRDTETAKAAMDAAITGHLVLSTVHANSAIGIYTRLMEMGVKPYLIAESLDLAVAQRLLRRVHDCARMEAPNRDELDWFTSQGLFPPPKVARPVGCAACSGGYRGRIAAVEVLKPTRKFRSLAASQASYEELETEALASGFRPILDDGLRHIAAGNTTVSEVARILGVATEETY